ncbi:hypothetical protein Hsero_0502 [Herbaspirillum seropedicae SmR1]|uniref:Uncharacterized protein n=1 Tax=Herbaspirillum seropedicae (strain SmR1) TaxID=757424 RepID=D8IXE6_HERSS|nr:hypothetical protein Hsero_0502 [Herbaspirillum seropedicae SmR1]
MPWRSPFCGRFSLRIYGYRLGESLNFPRDCTFRTNRRRGRAGRDRTTDFPWELSNLLFKSWANPVPSSFILLLSLPRFPLLGIFLRHLPPLIQLPEISPFDANLRQRPYATDWTDRGNTTLAHDAWLLLEMVGWEPNLTLRTRPNAFTG